MNLQQKVRFTLIVGFIAWGFSLGIRFQANWDALVMFILSFVLTRYKDE
tara:strand:- start:324 stop:470 length:147 start_codon:yes stop_codon:yes gene_type:complete